MRRIGKQIAACVTVAAAGLSLAACDKAEDPSSKTESITETANEAAMLQSDLEEAINRLVVDCMEDQGFDVHPQWMIGAEDDEENGFEPFDDALSPDVFDVPTLKDAEQQGFGNNLTLDPEYAEPDGEAKPDDAVDPYLEESAEYQTKYQLAQYGDEYYEWMGGNDDAEVLTPAPLEAGCTGEVSQKVYGDPIAPDPKDEDGEAPYYGVESPAAFQDWKRQEELYETEKLLDARDALSKCIEAEGYPYFEYAPDWGMGISAYADGFYVDGGESPPGYDLPKGAPWKDYDKAFAAEVAFATVVARCADDTGFREISKQAWHDAMETSAAENEKEVYSWYEDLKAALGKAQDLIGE